MYLLLSYNIDFYYRTYCSYANNEDLLARTQRSRALNSRRLIIMITDTVRQINFALIAKPSSVCDGMNFSRVSKMIDFTLLRRNTILLRVSHL